MMDSTTLTAALEQQAKHRALAWGCPLCRTVVVGDTRPTEHDCIFAGQMQELVPIGVVVDLFRRLRLVDEEAASG